MKIYAIIEAYDEGVWISESDPDHLLYSTLEKAEEAKLRMDAEELKKHQERESKRYERWMRMTAARSILDASNFIGIQEVLPGGGSSFNPSEFRSRTQIILLEVQE